MAQQQIISAQVVGGVGSTIEVKEVDGSPDVVSVTQVVVTNGTLTDNGGGSVTLVTGGGTPTELQATVYNGTGFTLNKGTIVTVDGGLSGTVAVLAADSSTQDEVFGMIVANIANGATGLCQVQGVVSNIDTTGLTANTAAYVGTAGALAAVPGVYGQMVGWVLTVNASTGSVFVAPNSVAESVQDHGHFGAGSGSALSFPIITDDLQWKESTTADAGTPPAGYQYLFVDSVDHKLKRVNSSSVVTIIG